MGPKLANEIKDVGVTSAEQYCGERNSDSLSLGTVDKKEIIDIVKKCLNKTSLDGDDIDMALIKKVIDGIATPLCHICNLSFEAGIFPAKMKIAKVIPLFKAGDKHNFTNYRPVSLLSQFSKILEKLYVERLDTFIDKHNILMDSQYGFRSSRSTSMALMELVEEITGCVDSKKYGVGIFIDLKKAFDTIDHEILIKKMDIYGVRGVAHKWLQSYIQNRKQYVQLGSHKSTCSNITFGVPQGSVLGPKLFILYINDIVKVSDVLKFIVFADDTNIFCSGEDLQQVLDVVKYEMLKLKCWFNSNKLSLNLNKTKFMIFGNRKINTTVYMEIDNIEVERVYEIKFLGVLIDHKLCWKPHIKYLCSKIARSIGIMGKTRHILNQKTLHTLYCALIVPFLSYCVEVWGNTYKSTLCRICTLQKRVMRIVHNTEYREHTNNLFLKSHTLKFPELVNFKTAQIMFKAWKDLLPRNIQRLFNKRDDTYDLRGKLNLKHPTIRTTMKSMCISVCGVRIWNDIDEEIKMCNDITNFKFKYKLYLIDKYVEL